VSYFERPQPQPSKPTIITGSIPKPFPIRASPKWIFCGFAHRR
jgi:hypothetical protein